MHSLSRVSSLFDCPTQSLFDLVAAPPYWRGGLIGNDRWSPTINVRETPTDFVIEAEVPGIPGDQIDVSVNGNTIVLKGEKSREVRKDDESGRTHLIESSYGSFSRMIRLPSPIDQERISAEAKNGLLTITVGKRDLPKQIRIDVKSG